ncbi:MAG: MotA/TolQ/ExbB proton channel family protein [Betaproteobacteria bacterium]|nr:MotA/TolQ/ExbB proton channel family protein [Betaproteobacteria bacterium]MDE2423732.1 MotA/TolQ/ExbB proton channel family protein [Betaproteobacteria bacterium]
MQLLSEAGWPSLLLLVASIISVAIIIDRALALRTSLIAPKGLLESVIALERSGSLSQEKKTLIAQESALGTVLIVALQYRHSSRELMKEAVEERGRSMVMRCEKHLPTLGTIAAVSPLLGLLGTVVGMIILFGQDSSLTTHAEQLARGISVALYNTAFGLIVAIPSMIFYRFYRSRIDFFAVEMEQQAIQLVDELTLKRDHGLS